MLELSKGTQLADRYTLNRKLGGGGEAVVWLAKDRLTTTLVALKCVAAESPSAARLRAEWQTSIRLMHAHIARAFEFHTDSDVAFYSRQYVDGPDISILSGLPPDEVMPPVGLIADALRYMHARGLVHRDVKASNILIDHNGAPYLTDFGVTVAAGEGGGGVSPEPSSIIAQSPQSLSGQPAAAADDVFALGGLIYELVAGIPAYSSADTAADIRQKVPPLLRAVNGELPAAVADLVAQMLDKDASRRPDAETVVQRLQAAGFTPSVATVRTGKRLGIDDDVVEVVQSIRPVPRVAADDSKTRPGQNSGISPMTALIGLGSLLTVLIAVVFVLPNRVQDDSVAQIDESEKAIGESLDEDSQKNDTAARRGRQRDDDLPVLALEGEEIGFSENTEDFSALDAEGRARFSAEQTLGELLSAFEVLEARGVERWASVEYRKAKDVYAEGDKAYLAKEFAYAEQKYLDAIAGLEPLYDRIEPTFLKAYGDAELAFENGDRLEALRLFELAVAITPGHPGAVAGLTRARNLEAVQRLVDQGLDFEKDLELEAAERSFAQAVELDILWEPAQEGLIRVTQHRKKMEFDLRMSEGFDAIAAGDYLSARAAFRVAQQLIPESNEPADGLLQIEQGLQLQKIGLLEREALSLEQDEHWDAVVATYEEILKVDSTLSFATDGLSHAREMSALHSRLDKLIAEPDRLSSSSVMRDATKLVVEITTRQDVGPRLEKQRDELSRLLKRAVTPLSVPLVSDNVTQVSIYRVGRLGVFTETKIELRPGTYVAVGVRPGYRDVRQEFRVAPEIDIETVVVRCEEQI